jgi:N6-L-threonylcarbamoyladenine synthase
LIISIESSCDDSSIAITEIESKRLVYSKRISQAEVHSEYGGVVPELASRLHLEALTSILEEIKDYTPYLRAVAVTTEPGLVVTLVEGVTMAKAISVALDIPIIGVNHLKGHIYSLFIEKPMEVPILVLLASGGHTQLIEMNSWNSFRVVASTLDDSLGESFDKVAKMMGLPYPGGPVIEKLANSGDENRFNFPVPLQQSPKMAFSYSGLKNAVRLQIESIETLSERDKCDISASFQYKATEHISQKLKKYLKSSNRKGLKKFAVVGGVSANLYIRGKLEKLVNGFGLELIAPEMRYTSDNGEMIGRFAIELFQNNQFSELNKIEIKSRSLL